MSKDGTTTRKQGKGRQQLRWEDYARRDINILGEDERWKDGATEGPFWEETHSGRFGNTPRDHHPCTPGNKEKDNKCVRVYTCGGTDVDVFC